MNPTKAAKFYCPVLTIFNDDGTLDLPGNRALWDSIIGGGIDGIVLMGSTGEFFAMPDAQKRELIAEAVDWRCRMTGEHGVPVVSGQPAASSTDAVELIVGTACLRVDDTIELSNYALDAGADAVMVVPPYYFALDDEAIFAFFDAVAEGVHGPLYLYNFPARTGYDIGVAVTRRLLEKHPHIVGFKDTVTEVGHTRALAAHLLPDFPDFQILAGFDEWGHRVVTSGGAGVIGGLSNLYPEICAAYMAAINSGDAAEIAVQQRKVDLMMDFYTLGSPFVPILKSALKMRGLIGSDYCIPPVQPATPRQRGAIKQLMDQVEGR